MMYIIVGILGFLFGVVISFSAIFEEITAKDYFELRDKVRTRNAEQYLKNRV